jgi:hypothetical protein
LRTRTSWSADRCCSCLVIYRQLDLREANAGVHPEGYGAIFPYMTVENAEELGCSGRVLDGYGCTATAFVQRINVGSNHAATNISESVRCRRAAVADAQLNSLCCSGAADMTVGDHLLYRIFERYQGLIDVLCGMRH